MYFLFFLACFITPLMNMALEKQADTQSITHNVGVDGQIYADLLQEQHLYALNYCFPNSPQLAQNICNAGSYGGGKVVPATVNQTAVRLGFKSWTDGQSFFATTICGNPGSGTPQAGDIVDAFEKNNTSSSRIFINRNGLLVNNTQSRTTTIPNMPAGNPCPKDNQVIYINEMNNFNFN